MDADTLRLILIVAGGLFLVGFYLWERRRARPEQEEPLEDQDLDVDKLEPQLGAWHEDEGGERGVTAARGGAGEQGWPSQVPEQPEFQLEPPSSAPEDLASEAPSSPLILSFYITPREGVFEGEAIVQAAGQCGVEPGEMDVFYRYAAPEFRRSPLFTLANAKDPGSFPFGDMEGFESRGLALFAQVEGASDDSARLEEMLAVAHCLAGQLDGQIRDGSKAVLTPEKEDRLRDQVLELVTWRLSDTAQE